MIFDHVDVRVRQIGAVRAFYDRFLRAFGFRGKPQPDGNVVYVRVAERKVHEAVALIAESDHRPNHTRVAFSAASPAEVDRIAAIAAGAGARAFEAPAFCPEIGENYYAAFFEDPDGNRLEIVCR
ncbi:MAG: VOC family protein [Candidatus Eremiobacteraeota bacterium]|nr:VOC family protein [Candidatus Eremiobacteraeota bacterium]MBV8356086.1 VOC family protein [Candidatus Eremiobacteraeota bacterium]